jgi:hypothetical protein
MIDLGSEARLPGDYAAGQALGTSYKLDMLLDEARLRLDLQTIIRAYRALTYRGGVDADMEGQTNVADDFALTRQMSITETRKYAYHRKVERNPLTLEAGSEARIGPLQRLAKPSSASPLLANCSVRADKSPTSSPRSVTTRSCNNTDRVFAQPGSICAVSGIVNTCPRSLEKRQGRAV